MVRNKVSDIGCDEQLFRRIVKTTFNQRRKMLRVSLKQLLKPDSSLLDPSSEVNKQYSQFLTLRPEQLSIAQFVELTNLVAKESASDNRV
jgi:16S rRNA (adenine1518-N6/adenine1519-N6)-dimethyltransferase